jgi:hypothetical protein
MSIGYLHRPSTKFKGLEAKLRCCLGPPWRLQTKIYASSKTGPCSNHILLRAEKKELGDDLPMMV